MTASSRFTTVFGKLRRFRARHLVRLFMYILLIDLTFVFLYPFLYMAVTSLKSPSDITDLSVNWILSEVYVGNYTLSWEMLDYPVRLLRTMLVTLACTAGHILSCAFIGYGFARFRFKGRNLMFVLLLLSMIVPTETIIAPLYLLFAKLHLVDTVLPLILPTWFGFGLKGALFVFLFRQFYQSLPPSLEEAAQVDGCGAVRTFFSIAFPASRSSILVCLVLSLVWHWNDYFEPLIYINKDSEKLLPMLLPQLYAVIENAGLGAAGGLASDPDLDKVFTKGVAMAATVLVVLPVFILYMFLQKKFVQGVEWSGITGE